MTHLDLVEAFRKCGYEPTHETVKLTEFTGPSDQVVYVYKDQAFREGIQCVIHPEVDPTPVLGLLGVRSKTGKPFRKGSNMRRFPKQHPDGARAPIPYGRSLLLNDIPSLQRMLTALKHL